MRARVRYCGGAATWVHRLGQNGPESARSFAPRPIRRAAAVDATDWTYFGLMQCPKYMQEHNAVILPSAAITTAIGRTPSCDRERFMNLQGRRLHGIHHRPSIVPPSVHYELRLCPLLLQPRPLFPHHYYLPDCSGHTTYVLAWCKLKPSPNVHWRWRDSCAFWRE